jgi:hypothetical protein
MPESKHAEHQPRLCNSEFQVEQLNHVTKVSGIPSVHLFGNYKDMIGQAYGLLDIIGNDLIKTRVN